jgi:hypothetical protein
LELILLDYLLSDSGVVSLKPLKIFSRTFLLNRRKVVELVYIEIVGELIQIFFDKLLFNFFDALEFLKKSLNTDFYLAFLLKNIGQTRGLVDAEVRLFF